MPIAIGITGVALVLLGCSSADPPVAGVRCTPGGTPFQAPSLMTTGGGARSFGELGHAMQPSQGPGSASPNVTPDKGGGDGEPCNEPFVDAGTAAAF